MEARILFFPVLVPTEGIADYSAMAKGMGRKEPAKIATLKPGRGVRGLPADYNQVLLERSCHPMLLTSCQGSRHTSRHLYSHTWCEIKSPVVR